MPTIPTYQRQTKDPRSINAPRQNINVPNAAFGGASAKNMAQLGNSLSRVGNAMAQITARQNAEKEDAWASQAMATLATQYDAYTFGNDTNPGAYRTTGEKANGLTKRANEDLQKMIDTVAQDAPGDRAANAFKQRALSLKSSTARSIARHESDQMKSWAINSAANNAQAQAKHIEAHWSWEPERIESELEAQVTPEVVKVAKLKGVPVEQLVRSQKEKSYASVINQNLASGATEKAKGLLERWSDDLSSETRTRLTGAIRKKEIDAQAEDTAFSYYNELKAGATTQTAAAEEIRQIEDPDLRRTTRRMFDAYARQHKADQTAWVAQESVARLDELDNLYGDLVAQQKFVDEYAADPKVKTKLEARLKRFKAAEGLKPLTSPEAFADATEQILAGEINTAEQIDLLTDVEKQDKDDLKKSLGAAQKTTKRSLKNAYTQAFGIAGGAEATLKKGRKKDFGEFLLWAEGMVKETNRAQEPEYFQKLADQWAMTGERKRPFTPGYGRDMTFGYAVQQDREDEWLPDMPEKEITAGIEQVFKNDRELYKRLMLRYEGRHEWAIRAYYKKILESETGRKQ